nr:hypothetical protein Iba_scaffold41534CG0010 [Ipomoea batatas]
MHPKRSWSDSLPAIHRVDIPEGGVHENHIGDEYASRVQEFNETWTRELKSSLPPHVPPDIALAINYFRKPYDYPARVMSKEKG